MQKRNIMILSGLIAAALIGGALVMTNSPRVKPSSTVADSTKPISTTEAQAVQKETTPDNSVDGISQADEDSQVQVVKSEDIQVQNNSLEYDLKVSIYENSLKEIFLKFEYYNDGISVIKELDSKQISELEGLFEKRQGQTDDKQGYRVRSLFLNIKNSKAYFMIEGEANPKWGNETIYSFNLKDFSLKKLYAGKGSYTDMAFAKNSKYLAFSYKEEPASGNSFLEVIKCEPYEMVIDKNRDTKGALIGRNTDSAGKYNYTFTSWYSSSIAKLKETAYAKDTSNSTGEVKKQRELLYDIEKNVFLNLDGSPMSDGGTVPGKDKVQVKAESDAVKAVRSFYMYLSTGEYAKVYDILDDKFTLNAFKLLGVTELSKSDISVQDFTMYGSLFKTARLDSIVDEKAEGNTSTIYLYQSFSMGESDQVQQPLVAKLRKTDNGWKVMSVSDGNINEKPFKQ